MLINFKVSNFRSFGEVQEMNLLASKAKTGLDNHCIALPDSKGSVLKLALTYGTNGAGKSNLVRAIDFARDLVVDGSNRLQRLKLSQFRFTSDAASSSTFEFMFLAGNRIYTYGFEVSEDLVAKEWLLTKMEKGRTFSVFKRDGTAIEFGDLHKLKLTDPRSEQTIKALEVLGVRSNQLMLNKICDLEEDRRGELLNSAVDWFTDSLVTIHTESSFGPIVELLDSDIVFRERVGEFLNAAGTGIRDLSVDKTEIAVEQLPTQLVESLHSQEGNEILGIAVGSGISLQLDPKDSNNVIRRNLISRHAVDSENNSLPFYDESDGTQKLLNLLPALIKTEASTRVFIIDELDRSLHPYLTKLLIRYFIGANPEGTRQLIIRRDEIWFAEKDANQQTQLYPLTDMKARKDLKIDKSYLEGRFGGIPYQNLDDVLKNLLAE